LTLGKGADIIKPSHSDDFEFTGMKPQARLFGEVSGSTSRIPTDLLESDVVLDSGQTDFSITGLRVTSTLRLHRLMTVTTALIRRELVELSPRMQVEVADKLRTLFSLT
jgi:mRNA interferase MazF